MKMSKKGEWLVVSIPQDWRGSTIEYILRHEWKVPKKQLHLLRMNRGVKWNGELPHWDKELNTGDTLQVHLFQPEEFGVIPTYMDLDILYEDDHVLVVNKPAGMNVHPNQEGQSDTLANGVAFHYQSQGFEIKVRHIHRLDQDTTGAVLFAKHPLASATMDRTLEQREIKRTYLALAEGKVKDKKGTIRERIGKDRHHPSRRRVSPTGQEAVTNYERLEYDPENKLSLLKIQLDTGRTHQIRVHLSHIGHPLHGDTLYGGSKKAPRQALHAAKVAFPHPLSNEIIECVAPFIDEPALFPNDVRAYIDRK